MDWFEVLTGFPEQSPGQVRANLRLEGTKLISRVNDRSMEAGVFSTPSLTSCRGEIELPTGPRRIRVSELVGDVRSLHQDAANNDAVFQVASQFNCLEMVSPNVTPEQGVGIYQNDLTQGPACSICAGAGTIVRNYFADTNGQTGQTRDNQIDCLAEIARHFDNEQNRLWEMKNGYCLPTSKQSLASVEHQLGDCDEAAYDQIRAKLQVGVQSKTQVTVGECAHRVTQVFCSALPVAYSNLPASSWNHFPKLVLESTYEATFYAALQNLANSGSNRLFLTLVGGGVFGNRLAWILSAIARSLEMFSAVPLDVRIVSYGASKPEVKAFAADWRRSE